MHSSLILRKEVSNRRHRTETTHRRLHTYVAFYLGGGKNGAINRKNASYVSSYMFSMRVNGMNVPLQKMCRQNKDKIVLL